MWKLKWLALLASVTVSGLCGCATATYPPSVLNDDRYMNFAYQYSVEIPQGWETHDAAPQDFVFRTGNGFDGEVSLVLIHPSTGSVMGITNLAQADPFEDILQVPDKHLNRIADELREQFEDQAEVIRYNGEIRPANLEETLRNYHSHKKSFKPSAFMEFEADMTHTLWDTTTGGKWFLYPCHGNKTCQLIMIACSDKRQYGQIRPSYDAFVQSFTAHDTAEH